MAALKEPSIPAGSSSHTRSCPRVITPSLYVPPHSAVVAAGQMSVGLLGLFGFGLPFPQLEGVLTTNRVDVAAVERIRVDLKFWARHWEIKSDNCCLHRIAFFSAFLNRSHQADQYRISIFS